MQTIENTENLALTEKRSLYRGSWRDLTAEAARRGMTLVEVMVVIAIILAVMGILAVGIFQIFSDSQVDTTKLQMSKVAQRVEIHMLRKGLPSSSDGLSVIFPEGVPKDSWGNDFQYITPGPNGRKFDLVSYGEDGSQGGSGNGEDIRYSDFAK